MTIAREGGRWGGPGVVDSTQVTRAPARYSYRYALGRFASWYTSQCSTPSFILRPVAGS